MRGARLLLAVMAALAVSACARQQPAYYVIDPNTGQPVPVVTQQHAAAAICQPAMPAATAPSDRGLYSSSPAYAQQAYAQPPHHEQQPDAQQTYAAAALCPAAFRAIRLTRSRAMASAGCSRNAARAPRGRSMCRRMTRSSPTMRSRNMPRRKADLTPSRPTTPTPRCPRPIMRPTRSTAATGCASWCSARTASPTATRSTPAATSTCRWSAACRRAASAPSSCRR